MVHSCIEWQSASGVVQVVAVVARSVLRGHQRAVSAVAVVAGGGIVSASQDKTAVEWTRGASCEWRPVAHSSLVHWF